MLITVEIPDKLDKQINSVIKDLELTPSSFIKMATEQFLKQENDYSSYPFDKVENLIGCVESGVPDLGINHRKHLAEKFKS